MTLHVIKGKLFRYAIIDIIISVVLKNVMMGGK